MSLNVDLVVLVQDVMHDLIDEHNLNVIPITDSQVALLTQSYLINIFTDREGLSMVYFDAASKPIKGYNIELFLIHKRRELLVFSNHEQDYVSHGDFIVHQLDVLAQHLRNAGKDILLGSKDWIAGYSWLTVSSNQAVNKLLDV